MNFLTKLIPIDLAIIKKHPSQNFMKNFGKGCAAYIELS
jgi:hypothetical protein